MYTIRIIQQSTISNYSLNNQRDLISDTAENLTQVGQWSMKDFQKEKEQITLYLMLTRKNLTALATFPLSSAFMTTFQQCCKSYDNLEAEFQAGVVDQKAWAKAMIELGEKLTKNIHLI